MHQDRGSVNDARRLAETLLRGRDVLALGAYVHVKGGVRSTTHRYPESTRMLARMVGKVFPRDFFCAMQLQRTHSQGPHKDRQNAHFPTLLLNLSPGALGGTWVEDQRGQEWVRCMDGTLRRGSPYRFSGRSLWHMAAPTTEECLVLLAWVPAGWSCVGTSELANLPPDMAAEERSRLSEWSTKALVQRSLVDVVQPKRHLWGLGPWGSATTACATSCTACLHVFR